MAIGSDAQFSRISLQPMFAALARERWSTNEGRRASKGELHTAIEGITSKRTSVQVAEALKAAGIPHSPITPIEDVPDLPFVAEAALRTAAPDGSLIRLPPPATRTDHLDMMGGRLPFCPPYGGSTDSLLMEAGLSESEIASLRERGVVA